MRCSLCGKKAAEAAAAKSKSRAFLRSEGGALNWGSLPRASRSFPHVVHELFESSAHLSGGGRLGLNAGIVNALRYRRSPSSWPLGSRTAAASAPARSP